MGHDNILAEGLAICIVVAFAAMADISRRDCREFCYGGLLGQLGFTMARSHAPQGSITYYVDGGKLLTLERVLPCPRRGEARRYIATPILSEFEGNDSQTLNA